MNLADKLDMLKEQNPQASQAEIVAMLSDDEKAVLFDGFTDEDFANLEYDPDFWLRPSQKIYSKNSDGSEWSRALLVCGRGWGKMCDVDHILPTPDGWKKLGDIQDGDKLFDEQGNICTVVKAHPVQLPKKAYKLTFSDGTSITAGEEHLWTTWTHSARKSYNRRNEYNHVDDSIGIPDDWPTWEKIGRWGKPTGIGPKTITTQEIVDTFRHGKRGDVNHSIPVTAPLQYPEKDLPIDPYLFGVHLGDGSHSTSSIAIHKDEYEWMSSFLKSRGHDVSDLKRDADPKKNAGVFRVQGLAKLLRDNELVGIYKPIPREYLEGSEQQRRDLLAGLLDTDGHVNPKNQHVEFCARRRHHADAVMELARSLGQKPSLTVGRATLNEKDYGEKYRVTWRPTDNFFYMPRKRAIFQMPEAQASRNYHRMIVSFEEVPAVPMRCLTVDSPNHLFLIGEGMIPTHNTLTVSHWLRKKAMENPGSYGFLAGRTVADVRNILVNGQSGILAVSPESERPEYKSHTASLHWPNGTTALLLSSEAPDGARGPQAHFAVCDEVAAWKTTPDSSGATLYDNIIAATRLGKNPQIVMATTPKRTKFMRDRLEEAADPARRIKVIRGSTFENRSLSSEYIEGFTASYGDSDLAKQELMGEMLDDAEGIVFTDEIINKALDYDGYMPTLHKIIAVDPSVAEDPTKADECGIMIMGVTKESDFRKRKVYLIDDISIRASPEQWSKHIVEKAKEHEIVDIVAEQNQGYGLIKAVLNAEDSSLRVHLVHAKRNKITRAEPVVVVMDNGRVKMVEEFPTLIDQLLFYDPSMKKSPDRMDAFVWGVTALIIDPPPTMRMGTLHIARTPKLSIPQRLDRQAGLLIPRNIRY